MPLRKFVTEHEVPSSFLRCKPLMRQVKMPVTTPKAWLVSKVFYENLAIALFCTVGAAIMIGVWRNARRTKKNTDISGKDKATSNGSGTT